MRFRNYINNFVNEATFRAEDLKKVCKNYAALFSKGLGGTLRYWCTETFERDGEEGIGVRMANTTGSMLRFNFSKEITGFANSEALVLSSIDYWKSGNTDLECPSVTCKFSREVNAIKIWRKLSDIIVNAKFGKYTAPALGTSVNEEVENFGSVRARKDFLTAKGLPAWRGMSPDNFKNTVIQNGLDSEWNAYIATVSPGKPERNSTEAKIQKTEAQFDKTEYGDPSVIFKDIVTLTKHLRKSKMKLLSIFGMGGLGKCIDVATLVATPNGPVRAGDIKVGDKVLAANGEPANVVDVYPQDELKECYEVVLSDGRSVVADEEQLFNVKINENFENVPLKDIMETFKTREVVFPVCNKEFVRSEIPLKEIKPVGPRETICFRIDNPDHLFLTADYMIVHNTYEVKTTLKSVFGPEPSKYWVYIPAGKFTTRKFYEEVFAARDKIICFDEADNIITNDEIVTMLKPALDTSGDNQMTYNTGTKPMSDFSKDEVEEYSAMCDEYMRDQGVQFSFGRKFGKSENIVGTNNFDEDSEATGVWAPARFFFTGKMIFISNLSKDKIDAALLTRGPKVDVNLDLQGKLARIESVLKAQGHPQEEIDELLIQLKKRGDGEHISVRTVVTYLDFKEDGDISPAEALRIASNYG